MKKILVVNSTNNVISGAEFAIVDMLSTPFQNLNFEMHTPGNGPLSDFYIDNDFTVKTRLFPGPRKLFFGIFYFTSFLYSLFLRIGKYDLVLCNTFAASFRVSLAAKMAGVPLVIYVREYLSLEKQINLIQLKRAKGILAVSQDIANYLNGFHENITVCHDTINVADIKKISGSKILFNQTDFNVGFVGRITAYKQPDLLLKSALILKEKIPNLKIHVVGSQNSYEDKFYKQLIDFTVNQDLVDNVIFWGQRKDALEILSELDVFCMISDREPFPRTLIEAMILGTAIIAANSGGCVEIVENEKEVLLFDSSAPNSDNLLAEHILRIYNDELLKAKLVFNSKEKAEKIFGLGSQRIDFYYSIQSFFKK